MDYKITVTRRSLIASMGALGAAGAAMGLFGCSQGPSQSSQTASQASSSAAASSSGVALDKSAWSYDSSSNVYYQLGVRYCENPQAPTYESMGIYVPGAYFDAKDNGNGTYTCTPSASGKIGDYTAATAPIVMPINTAGYSAQAAPTSYNSNGLSSYLEAGFVYVYAGCRGRKMEDSASGGAPWGVTDLKAAVRTLRYNDELIPGDKNHIFSFGHSGGGAQSAVLGSTGDAPGYDAYLKAIGAPTTDANGKTLSDSIFGAMCWCPITCLLSAVPAYEWNMGQFASSGTRAEGTFTRQLSQDLAASYANYINALGLVDASGKELSLQSGGEGIATAGTYYDYVKGQVETSLNNFLADTTFPYTPSNSFNADMGAGGGASGGASGGPSGSKPSGGSSSGNAPSGDLSSGEAPSGDSIPGETTSTAASMETAKSGGPSGSPGGTSGKSGKSSSGSSDSTTYATAADYIASLNGDDPWITYDEATNTATISGLAGFARTCKSASKDVGAFDALDRTKAENEIFGNESTEGLHFDATMETLLNQNADAYSKLSNWNASYPSDWTNDRKFVDAQGNSSDFRQQLYDPLYYLSDAYEGSGTSTPAAHWRIRTGITQGDTASTTEINLALALSANKKVKDVDFATVWGQGHTMAERTGSSTQNFIAWVNECCK